MVDFWGTSHATLATDERELLTDFAHTVPTVLVTGRGWASDEMAEEIGLAALVRKPFDVAEMSEVVRSCMAKVQADSEAPTVADAGRPQMTLASVVSSVSRSNGFERYAFAPRSRAFAVRLRPR